MSKTVITKSYKQRFKEVLDLITIIPKFKKH